MKKVALALLFVLGLSLAAPLVSSSYAQENPPAPEEPQPEKPSGE